jgi:hypothetical protein
VWLRMSLSSFFFFSPFHVMLFLWYLRQKRHLQSTKDSNEKEGQNDNTDYVTISLTLLSMSIPKLCCHPLVSVSRYSAANHNHFCAVLILIVLAASWRHHGR